MKKKFKLWDKVKIPKTKSVSSSYEESKLEPYEEQLQYEIY